MIVSQGAKHLEKDAEGFNEKVVKARFEIHLKQQCFKCSFGDAYHTQMLEMLFRRFPAPVQKDAEGFNEIHLKQNL